MKNNEILKKSAEKRTGLKRSIETKAKISKGHTGKPKMKLRKIENGGEGKNWTCGLTKENNEKFRKRCLKALETRNSFSEKKKKEISNKIRKSAINYLKDVRHIPYPCIGKNETQIIDHFEKVLGFGFERQFPCEGFFIDGYSPMLNLAIEVDESFHQNRIQEDLDREQLIKNELNCSILRIQSNKIIGGDYCDAS